MSLLVVCDVVSGVAHPKSEACEHPTTELNFVSAYPNPVAVTMDLVGVLMPGDSLHDFRGDVWQFIRVSRLAAEGKSAKVIVEYGGIRREFYTSVFPSLTVSAL